MLEQEIITLQKKHTKNSFKSLVLRNETFFSFLSNIIDKRLFACYNHFVEYI